MLAFMLLLAQDVFKIGEPERIGDATVRSVMLSSPEVRRADWAFATLFFLDAASVLVCEPRGQLRRLSFQGLKSEAQARLPANVNAYALSSAGLLALTKDGEILVVDTTRLEVLKTIRAPNVKMLASSPALDVAFINGDRFSLETLSLTSGESVRKHDPERVHAEFDRRIKKPEGGPIRFGDFSGPLDCSPDGRYLYCATSRFAISGYDLLHEEIRRPDGHHPTPRVSLDGRHYCIPGQTFAPSMVLSATDFHERAAVIPQEHALTDLDVVGESVIGLGCFTGFVFEVGVFSFNGERRSVARIRGSAAPSKRLFVSPDGKRAAVPFNNGMYWLEWK